MCKPVYAIDTPAGRIGIFEGDESEDFHGIRIFWIDENDAVIDLIAMIEGESANYLECKGIGDATKTCYADAVGRKISCSDSETFEEIVNILRSAGYEVCGV